MLEISGGIILAIVVLIFVLANFGWIVVGLSAIFAVGVVVVGTVLVFSLPTDNRNAILVILLGIAAVSAFGYWTHVDKRFLLPDDDPNKDNG
ncbi:hypothetical protein [Bradyrhizobium sp.]|uniref:hypothetical protein n=1 Tax=Bradyrhizobium sp. TaxID=376 RepID=UPI003C796DA0